MWPLISDPWFIAQAPSGGTALHPSAAMKRVRVTFEVSVKDAKPGDKVFVVGGITMHMTMGIR